MTLSHCALSVLGLSMVGAISKEGAAIFIVADLVFFFLLKWVRDDLRYWVSESSYCLLFRVVYSNFYIFLMPFSYHFKTKSFHGVERFWYDQYSN
jgi:hypothetical protein